ncbi:hypothetical protein GEMRC1_007021 [Eukaryota sp. GEM-RC1]
MKRRAFVSPLLVAQKKGRTNDISSSLPVTPKSKSLSQPKAAISRHIPKIAPPSLPTVSSSIPCSPQYWKVMWNKRSGKDRKKLNDGFLSIDGKLFLSL